MIEFMEYVREKKNAPDTRSNCFLFLLFFKMEYKCTLLNYVVEKHSLVL